MTRMDCNRGCVCVTDAASGEEHFTYREGCCKLRDHNYLAGIPDQSFKDIFEVRTALSFAMKTRISFSGQAGNTSSA